jgi:16S rRNA processing protein RimM
MIAVGRITKGVGIKGEVRISLLTDNPDRFARLKVVWCGKDEATSVRCSVLAVRIEPRAVVLKLKEIESRSSADEHRGDFLFVKTQETVRPGKGSYFIHEIVGMNVSTETGDDVGTVTDVMELPANDVWVVTSGDKEFLIPAIKEVIRSVDVERRVVVIRPLEGMLE